MWLKVDDRFPGHQKVWDLSDRAFRLHVSAMCLSAERGYDGWVPTNRLTMIVKRLPNPKVVVAELIAAGLWHETSRSCSACLDEREECRVQGPLPKGGYMIHDFLKYNPPAWKVVAERASRRSAGRAGGEASAQARAAARGQANGQARAAANAQAPAQASAQAKRQPRTSSPVPESFSSPYQGEAGADQTHEPPIPEGPKDADRSRDLGTRQGGLHHVGAAAARVARG